MTDVLTLALDAESQGFYEALRQQHFPPERNQIPAHLTLFHTLPREPWVRERLATIAAAHPVFRLESTGPRSLGRGVALFLRSPELVALHRDLSNAFADVLSAQDRQPLRPHIVVQNKSTPEAARALLAQMQASFSPRASTGIGLDLWHYLGGPWQHALRVPLPAMT